MNIPYKVSMLRCSVLCFWGSSEHWTQVRAAAQYEAHNKEPPHNPPFKTVICKQVFFCVSESYFHHRRFSTQIERWERCPQSSAPLSGSGGIISTGNPHPYITYCKYKMYKSTNDKIMQQCRWDLYTSSVQPLSLSMWFKMSFLFLKSLNS